VSKSGVGGYPKYNTYNTITDNDKDGMDDAWELANGLDPNNPNDRNLRVGSTTGYTVLEAYLNFLVGEIIPFDANNLTSVKNNPTANYDIIFGVENDQITISWRSSLLRI
jgi:Reverse gyrase